MSTYNANKLLQKKAGIYTDTLAGMASSGATSLPLTIAQADAAARGNYEDATLYGVLNQGIHSAAGTVSGLHGLFGRGDDDNEVAALREMNDNAAKALIPTVTAHRMNRRQRLIGRLLGSKSKYLHESFAHFNPINLIGAPFGALAALINRGRTVDEQAVEEQDKPWKDWLIPGMATYNTLKRLGVANRVGNSEKGDAIDREVMKYVKQKKK